MAQTLHLVGAAEITRVCGYRQAYDTDVEPFVEQRWSLILGVMFGF